MKICSNHKQLFFTFALLFLSIFTITFGQTNPKQTAEQKLEEIKKLWENNNQDSTYLLALQLQKEASLNALDHIEAKSNYYIGRYHQNTGSLDSSVYYLKNSNLQFIKVYDTLKIGITNFLIGVNYTYLGEVDSSLHHYITGKQWLEYTNDSVWNSTCNNYISISYFELGNYPLSLKYGLQSLDYLKTSHNKTAIGNTYNTIGNIYRKMQEPQKEEQAYLNAIAILEQIPLSYELGMTYNNISEIYLNKGEIEKGFEFLEKAKNCYEKMDYPLGMCSYYSVISHYYFYKSPPQYDKVIELSTKSIEIASKYNDPRQYADAAHYLGRALLYSKQIHEAEMILLKALQTASKHSLINEKANISGVLSDLYQKKNQYKKALKYNKQFYQLKDSLYDAEKVKEFTSLDLKYQFEQKQLSDSLKNKLEKAKLKLNYDIEIKTHNVQKRYLMLISFLFIAFAIFLLYISNKRRKTNFILRTQNDLITRQKSELQESSFQIKKALQELQELDYYKQTFTNMLVHDLKNPLNALVNIEVFPTENERLAITKYNSLQMLNLVLNMLDISKAENQKFEPIKTEISLQNIVKESIKNTEYLINQKGIKIHVLSDLDYTINGEHEILVRVLINLLTNAIKFNPPEEYILIKINQTDEQNITLSIKDKGPGIAKEEQEDIFKLFTQINQKKSGGIKSTGLGLAFCKLAIEAHSWEIGVHSSPGLGSEFWIKISNYSTSKNSIPEPAIKYAYNSSNLKLNDEDLKNLLPHLIQLQKLQVYAISDIKNVIAQINQLNIPEIQTWSEEILNSVSSYDEGKYVYLINSLLIS